MTGFTARPRALNLVLVAALAFAVAPANAAHASGPGSATFTITVDGAPVATSEVVLSGPDFRFGLGRWHQVSAEGTIEITVPAQHPVGLTELVVQDADDAVIGWTDLRVLQRVKQPARSQVGATASRGE